MTTENWPLGRFLLAAVVIVLTSIASCASPAPTPTPTPRPTLNLRNWDDYLGPTTLADFEQKVIGVALNHLGFSQNEVTSNALSGLASSAESKAF